MSQLLYFPSIKSSTTYCHSVFYYESTLTRIRNKSRNGDDEIDHCRSKPPHNDNNDVICRLTLRSLSMPKTRAQ